MDRLSGPEQQVESPRDCEYICLASKSLTLSSKTYTRLIGAQHRSDTASDTFETRVPIYKNMGALLQKFLGPGANPLVEVDASNSCSSECCDEVEVISSSSSEPHTHASAHAVTDSYNTIPPDIENTCSSGISVVAPKVCQTFGGKMDMKL